MVVIGGTGVNVSITIDVALGRGVIVIVGVQVGGNLKGVISCVGVAVSELLVVLHPASRIMNNEIKSILRITFNS
jgi:hypothetical protein